MSEVNEAAINAEVPKDAEAHTADLPKEYKGVQYPGKIALSGDIRGHYTGCKAIAFNSADEFNAWAETTPHVVVVSIVPFSAWTFMVLYTTALTAEEKDDIDAWGKDMRAFMEERQRQRDANKAAFEAEQKAKEAERYRLAEVGKKCEANHAKAIAEKREYKKKGK